MGDIIPLSHICTGIDLAPRFIDIADSRLMKESSLEYSSKFLLNHFYNKQLYYSLLGAYTLSRNSCPTCFVAVQKLQKSWKIKKSKKYSTLLHTQA